MPYILRKMPKHDLYYVSKKDDGERLNKNKPLPRDEAIKMMRALYAKEGLEYKEKKAMPLRARVQAGTEEAKLKMASVRAAKLKPKDENDA